VNLQAFVSRSKEEWATGEDEYPVIGDSVVFRYECETSDRLPPESAGRASLDQFVAAIGNQTTP